MTDTDSAFAPSGMSVTLKHNGKYEAPWIVFHGNPSAIRDQIVKTFDMDSANIGHLSLYEVIVDADRTSKAVFETSSQLGARVLKPGTPAATEQPSAGTESASVAEGTDPWASVGEGSTAPPSTPAAEEPAVNPLLAQIAAVTDVAALQKLWAANRAEFDADADLFATWKAKGKALQG